MSRAETAVRVASPSPDRVFAALIDPGALAGARSGIALPDARAAKPVMSEPDAKIGVVSRGREVSS